MIHAINLLFRLPLHPPYSPPSALPLTPTPPPPPPAHAPHTLQKRNRDPGKQLETGTATTFETRSSRSEWRGCPRRGGEECELGCEMAVGQNRFGIQFRLVGEFTTHFRSYFSGGLGCSLGGNRDFDSWPNALPPTSVVTWHLTRCH